MGRGLPCLFFRFAQQLGFPFADFAMFALDLLLAGFDQGLLGMSFGQGQDLSRQTVFFPADQRLAVL